MLESTIDSWPRKRWLFLAIVLFAGLLRYPPIFGCPLDGHIGTVYLPQMHDYAGTLASGEFPAWSNATAFGTPILAQGQIGAAYPIHLILYRLLSADTAFRFSMLLHFGFAVWFAYLCGRRFALTKWAAALTAIAFAGQGFFTIHATQQWSYTAGCWIPLALCATWQWLRSQNFNSLIALAAVLAIQLTAGHFQLAFYNQIFLMVFAIVSATFIRDWKIAFRVAGIAAAIAGAYVLAGVQTLPTAEFLMHADFRGRGVDFLESFTGSLWSGLMLLSPLILSNPLWDQVLWFSGKTSHAECFNYIGLISLCLAVHAVRRKSRDSLSLIMAGMLVFVLVMAILPALSIGWQLLDLPGFNLFNASGRWTVFLGLMLALLAGKGLDSLQVELLPRQLKNTAIAIVVTVGLAIGALYLTVSNHPFFTVTPDSLAQWKLEQYGYSAAMIEVGAVTPASELWTMLWRESLFLIVNVLLVLFFAWRLRPTSSLSTIRKFVVGWTLIDISLATLLLTPLTTASSSTINNSPTMGALIESSGQRVTGTSLMLPAIAGKTPLVDTTLYDQDQYWSQSLKPEERHVEVWKRTVESSLPVANHLSSYATKLEFYSFDENDVEFLRLADLRTFAYGPRNFSPRETDLIKLKQEVEDPALSTWVYGNATQSTWKIWELSDQVESSRAWAFPISLDSIPGTDPRLQMRPPPARRKMIDKATAITDIVDEGRRLTIRGNVSQRSVLSLSDVYYPGWTATVTQQSKSHAAKVERAFGGWRAVEIPDAGDFEVVMTFESAAVAQGTRLTLGSMAFCIMAVLLLRFAESPAPNGDASKSPVTS